MGNEGRRPRRAQSGHRSDMSERSFADELSFSLHTKSPEAT
jgi:hypothetical protein